MTESPRHVVLVGAGHASLQVVRGWQPTTPSSAVTLVSERPVAHYSAMVPGWLCGEYERADLSIALAPLARSAGVALRVSSVARLDPDARRLELADGSALGYDLALLDVGSVASGLGLPGVREHALPARPIGGFVEGYARDGSAPGRVVVVGGGAGGVELALAIASSGAEVRLVERAGRLLPDGSPKLAERLARHCARRGVSLVLGTAIREVSAKAVQPERGPALHFDRLIWATGGAPPELLSRSPLPRDERGFVSVRTTLQVEGYDDLLAAGDAAAIASFALPKAGVYAVRAGPIALHNLRALLAGKRLREFRPQRDFLALLNLGDGTAIASKWSRSLRGRWIRKLKDRIDRSWVRRFQPER